MTIRSLMTIRKSRGVYWASALRHRRSIRRFWRTGSPNQSGRAPAYTTASTVTQACRSRPVPDRARGQPVSAHSGNDRTDAEYGRWPRPPKPLGAARSRRRSRSHALRAASKKKGSFTA
ncbi:hypothetical protein HED50_23840 [Ochrobactrum oryzae]|nr:hypothetical protein [Brucella oryzae]